MASTGANSKRRATIPYESLAPQVVVQIEKCMKLSRDKKQKQDALEKARVNLSTALKDLTQHVPVACHLTLPPELGKFEYMSKEKSAAEASAPAKHVTTKMLANTLEKYARQTIFKDNPIPTKDWLDGYLHHLREKAQKESKKKKRVHVNSYIWKPPRARPPKRRVDQANPQSSKRTKNNLPTTSAMVT